ncbi:hypothetical protein F0L74_28125 [Chitinophaga agrisoli]|uniref:Lipocalin-like protein n=1 Tax=Chitinophaga agrisoli TaxID=2607653 RepID=A0A5B2VMJ1_9BACT|nr:hypothetical protein [Chitinophaga agrisoli]KAA2240044.1 hypothetical protein F0L74_28125 [Chitinophaga agrisoli]
MKKILLVLLATGIAFYACKKDDKADTTTPPTEEVEAVDTKDPQAMTAAIKVFYGANTKGTLPAPVGTGAPILKANSAPIPAINGHYAVIAPELTSGSVAGYYVQVNGADSYFKIDYSKARNARKAQAPGKRHGSFRMLGDNSDSVIVIKLPENATPDTFCITYAAYDSANHVSNAISTCIVIIPGGGGTEGAALVGNWKLNRKKYLAAENWMEDYYKPDTNYLQFKCSADTLDLCDGASGCMTLISSISWVDKEELTITAEGGYNYMYLDKFHNIERVHNSCTDPTYYEYSAGDSYNSIWSYNPATMQITIISGDPDNYEVGIVDVTELSATRMVFKGPEEYVEWVKK